MKNDNNLENCESAAVATATTASGEKAAQILAAVDKPNWESAKRFIYWRNYIPSEVRAIWPNRSIDCSVVAFAVASEVASSELYDDVF